MAGKKSIRIRLVKSLIGRLPKHRATIRGLGLSRINQTVELEDTKAIRGMVNQVQYLLEVQD